MIVYVPTQPGKLPTMAVAAAGYASREMEAVSFARLLPSNFKVLLSEALYPCPPFTRLRKLEVTRGYLSKNSSLVSK